MARQAQTEVSTRKGSANSATTTATAPGSLSREQLIEFYRLMYLSRRTDDREIVLKRQQKIFFQMNRNPSP